MKKKDRDLFRDAIDKMFIDMLTRADKEKCKISVTSDTNGEKHIVAEGSHTALLVTLAGLEKQILEKTHTTENEFNTIKETVITMEVK